MFLRGQCGGGWRLVFPVSAAHSSRLDDELRQAYLRWHGNVAAVRRELTEAGRQLPSLRTLQRAFGRETRPAERAATRSGEAGIRAHGLYVRWEAGHRNQVWQGDHKQLDVPVVPPRAKRPVRPWSTMFIDGYSRVITGWAISLRPSTSQAARSAPRRDAARRRGLGGRRDPGNAADRSTASKFRADAVRYGTGGHR